MAEAARRQGKRHVIAGEERTQILIGQDGIDILERAGSARIDPPDQTMRNGAAQECGFEGVMDVNVVKEPACATQQGIVFEAEQCIPDARLPRRVAHPFPPFDVFADAVFSGSRILEISRRR
jgi:hypothetical protein